MENFQQLPLAAKIDASNTFVKIRNIVSKNNNLIRIEKDLNLVLSVRGLRANSNSFFKISEPKLNTSNNNQISYIVDFAPKNMFSTSAIRREVSGDAVLKHFNIWLGILEQNIKVFIHPPESFKDQYEDEFEDWFEIVEENANTKPFDTKRQILITSIINTSILQLKDSGFEDEEVFEEANQLKKDISKLTMKQAFDSIKKLYAKLKFNGGLENVKIVYEVCRTEVIKMGFHLGTKNLGEQLLKLIETISE